MGFRSGFVISSTSFLFGVLFIAATFDFPLLYSSVLTDENVEAAERFYLGLYASPLAVTALLHGMIGLGLVGLIAKLHRWSELAKYFDGGSLALFMGALCMYLGVAVPNVRVLADPTNENLVHASAIQTQRNSQQDAYDAGHSTFQPPTGALTPDEKVAAIRIISASNSICVVLLSGVLLLQGTEWYLARQEAREAETRRRKQAADLAAKSPSLAARKSQ